MLLTPHLDSVPIARPAKLADREKIYAAAQTAVALHELSDAPSEVSDHQKAIKDRDEDRARRIFAEGRDPTALELQRPALVIKLEAMLSKYDELFIEDANQIRRYVTGKLIEESSDSARPSDRLRALELLGKISDVSLFAERHEVVIEHRGTEELEALLRSKLSTIIEGQAERVG
jgi:hypothetical protein